jgi:uncharacterized protein HemY
MHFDIDPKGLHYGQLLNQVWINTRKTQISISVKYLFSQMHIIGFSVFWSSILILKLGAHRGPWTQSDQRSPVAEHARALRMTNN